MGDIDYYFNTMKDWEKELLKRAREIYKQGEGELTLKIRARSDGGGIECILSGGNTARWLEEIRI